MNMFVVVVIIFSICILYYVLLKRIKKYLSIQKRFGYEVIKEYDGIRLVSQTLTPLLKKLKDKGYITIVKNESDKRNIDIKITNKGIKLKDKAIEVPKVFGKSFPLTKDELSIYKKLIYKLMNWEVK